MNIQEILKAADGANITISVTLADLKEFAQALIEETMNIAMERPMSVKKDIMEEVLPQKEVEELLNVKSTTLWRWDKTKYLCPVKLGRKNFYKKSDINKIIRDKVVIYESD